MIRVNGISGRLIRVDNHLIAILGEDRGEREHAVVVPIAAARITYGGTLSQWNPIAVKWVSGVPLVEITQGDQRTISVRGQSAGQRRAVSICQSVCVSTLCESGPVNDDLRCCPVGEVSKEEKSEEAT